MPNINFNSVFKFSVRSVVEGARGVLAKVSLDQGLFAPSFIVVFVSVISALNGHSLQVQTTL
jgi:hypothetical protein